MRVQFWGTRGSIATPGPETNRYGGNTPCVEAQADDGTRLIFDCGTGARKLGLALAKGGPVRAHVFIGHTHADHIQGLPFFVPAFVPGSHLTFYGPPGVDRTFPSAVGGLMDYPYFPVPMQDLPARLDFEEVSEGQFSIGDICVKTQYLNHTAPCMGWRVELGQASLVYATDHEPHAASLWRPDRAEGQFDPALMLHPSDARHVEFLRDADVLIHDAQYTAAEYPAKVGWGHSTLEYVLDVAIAARVKRLVLFHHDPARDDAAVDALLADARRRMAEAGASLEVIAAAEGLSLALAEDGRTGAGEQGPRAPRLPTRSRILVADDDPDVARLVESALRDDGYEVQVASDGAEALDLTRRQLFDLILLDLQMPGVDGLAACRQMRADPRLQDLPIVMLTAHREDEALLAGFAGGVTDYMTKPFSVAQLRARVQSWLTRAASPPSIAPIPPPAPDS